MRRGFPWGLDLTAVFVLCLTCPQPVFAQGSAGYFDAGVEAFERGDAAAAERAFAAAVEADPSFYRPGEGSAAYWWGRALAADGRRDDAHRAWSAGLGALERSNAFDPRLADAYVESVFAGKRRSEYARAAEAYLRVLARADQLEDERERCVAIRYVDQMRLLMSEDEAARLIVRSKSDRCDGWRLSAGAGSGLTAWWRSRDPLLTSDRNERLEIHLERIAHAQREYATRFSRLDDRGEIYVRFGEPARTRRLRQHDDPLANRNVASVEEVQDRQLSQLIRRMQDPERSPEADEVPSTIVPGDPFVVLPAGLPGGDIWFYDHIDKAGYYVFVKEGGTYRLGQISDLVPMQLTNFRARYRGSDNADHVERMLFGSDRELGIYGLLYYEHPDFAARLTAYELSKSLGRVGVGDLTTVWAEIRSEEELAVYERERRMPDQYADLFPDAGELPVHVRIARFLEEDGATRTEVYWAADDALLSNDGPDALRMVLTAVQTDEGYRMSHRRTYSFLYGSGTEEGCDSAERAMSCEPLPPQTTVLPGNSGRYHIALQWMERRDAENVNDGGSPDVENVDDGARSADAENADDGAGMLNAENVDDGAARPDANLTAADTAAGLRIATLRIDSLEALSNDPTNLEMSDLAPVAAGGLLTAPHDDTPLPPYPYHRLGAQDTVGLYFEVYHLRFGPDDQTHYTVEYEVARRARRGLFRRDREVRTAARATSHAGRSRSVRETILLAFDDPTPGQVDVIVRVRDDTSGRQVQRSIAFHLDE